MDNPTICFQKTVKLIWNSHHKNMKPHLVVQGGDVGVVRSVAVAGLPCVVHLFRGNNFNKSNGFSTTIRFATINFVQLFKEFQLYFILHFILKEHAGF